MLFPETDPRYFQTWQRVSLALQKRLRAWVPEAYFGADIARYQDRDEAYPLVVYEACRAFYGRPRTEFTYDVADPETLPAALRGIGRAMQDALDRIAQRLHAAGQPELARRYAPMWHLDILLAVRKRPKRLVALLACESALINGVIDHQAAEKRFLRALSAAGRIYGVNVDELRRVVFHAANGVENVFDGGVLQHGDPIAAGSPDLRVA